MGYRKYWSDGDWEVDACHFTPDVREDICFDVVTSGKPYDFGSPFPFTKRDYDIAAEYRVLFIDGWPELKNASYSDIKALPAVDKAEILDWFFSNWYETEDETTDDPDEISCWEEHEWEVQRDIALYGY